MDATFWALIALAILIVLFIFYRVPGRLGQALDDHSKKIAKELEEVAYLKKEAASLFQQQEKRLKDVEHDVAGVLEQAERMSLRLSEEAQVRVLELSAFYRKTSEDKISQMKAQALREVQDILVTRILEKTTLLLDQKGKESSPAIFLWALSDIPDRLPKTSENSA